MPHGVVPHGVVPHGVLPHGVLPHGVAITDILASMRRVAGSALCGFKSQLSDPALCGMQTTASRRIPITFTASKGCETLVFQSRDRDRLPLLWCRYTTATTIIISEVPTNLQFGIAAPRHSSAQTVSPTRSPSP